MDERRADAKGKPGGPFGPPGGAARGAAPWGGGRPASSDQDIPELGVVGARIAARAFWHLCHRQFPFRLFVRLLSLGGRSNRRLDWFERRRQPGKEPRQGFMACNP